VIELVVVVVVLQMTIVTMMVAEFRKTHLKKAQPTGFLGFY